MSALVPPERLAAFLATSPAWIEGEMVDEMVQAFGERSRELLGIGSGAGASIPGPRATSPPGGRAT